MVECVFCCKFWEAIKPYFNKNELNFNRYLLLEKDVLIRNAREIVKTFIEHFINDASRLKLRHCPNSLNKR